MKIQITTDYASTTFANTTCDFPFLNVAQQQILENL